MINCKSDQILLQFKFRHIVEKEQIFQLHRNLGICPWDYVGRRRLFVQYAYFQRNPTYTNTNYNYQRPRGQMNNLPLIERYK